MSPARTASVPRRFWRISSRGTAVPEVRPGASALREARRSFTRPERRSHFLALFLAVVPALLVWRATRDAWPAPLLDPDLWWQLWSGEQMLRGVFPRENALSWTAPHVQ